MNIRPKSPELTQAQIASFAAETVERHEARQHIFNSIGSLAVGNVAEITYTSKTDEYLRDENGDYIRTEDGLAMIPKGTELTAATKDEYTQYLRTVGGSRHEAITTRTNLLKQYTQFEPDITRLAGKLASAENEKNHPAYLGSGSNTAAFRVDHEGEQYAVRIGTGARSGGAMGVDSRAIVTARAKGVPHLEQVVAMSYDNSAIVTELMPGRELGKDTPIESMQQVTDEQLFDFVDTVIAANKRGIDIDPKPTNIFYDSEEGFGIIDLNPANSSTELGRTVGDMATSLSNTGFYGGSSVNKITPEDYAQDLEWKKVHLDLVTRYRAAVLDKLDGVDLDNALEMIDKNIEYAHSEIEQLSNPGEVAARIARAKEFAERKKPTGGWTSV